MRALAAIILARTLSTLAMREPRALRHVAGRATELAGGLVQREHTFTCPLDWSAAPAAPADGARAETIDVYVRELVLAKHGAGGAQLPYLLYLQGGPGFPAPRPGAPPTGWLKSALDTYRVLLLDQRGVGRSTPVTAETLVTRGDAEAQARYLTCLRADSIVRDCEAVRVALGGDACKLTLLGQSYGGFCILTYLSLFPASLERALLTCGLAPVGQSAEAVYRSTFERMRERNRRFYQRYPQDAPKVRAIARALRDAPAPLPSGGTLTVRRFLQLGLLLGSSTGFETLHQLLEAPFLGAHTMPPAGAPVRLSREFLRDVEARQAGFETNPIYWLLHEAIYADGPHQPTAWAAHRVLRDELAGSPFDVDAALAHADARAGADGAAATGDAAAAEPPPLYLSGEMVYPWMAADYAELAPLAPAAELVARKADWPRLYDEDALRACAVPVAALVAYDDIYVERAFSERVAQLLGERCVIWVTNQFAHSGLRDDPTVFAKLLEMSKGEGGIPS
ncbi:hypothetical protein KFE25_008323 [Diacronema lutheri]|uniref:AB hydrolase-1 domain-containing protein n=3 Tax=Diacronema lutheri TaxID=2081491 RepID=A0A8J6CBV9_DIALT|nr:hypothetical protein KFE25_008323 [Diacronema lutheri]